MAIAGFLVQVLPDKAEVVEKHIMAVAGLTSYGLHEDSNLVVVAESSADKLESLMERIKKLDGVLSVSLTSLTTQDELPD